MSCLSNSHIRIKEMGTLRARTREYSCRGKVRPSHCGAAAAAADAIPEDAEERLREMLEQLMDSLEQLREEMVTGFLSMDNQFNFLHALSQRMGQRLAGVESCISAQPGPSFRPFPPEDRSG